MFQQGNRWLNWLEKQLEGSVRPVVIESVTKIMNRPGFPGECFICELRLP
ncbi:hypothetical protein ACUYMX_004506, partial [Escherichia coli]